MTTTPQHCPGMENLKKLQSFMCACPECGQKKEIFSDEFDQSHICSNCKKPIDFTQCQLEGSGGMSDSR